MNEEKKLSIEGILSSGSDLNQASVRLNEVCKEMYQYVTALRESETFKTVVASTAYFGSIDELNAMVPKYSEAILRFSKFLTEYVVENYTETDEETKAKIDANLASSIEQLQSLGAINNQGLDYTKIASISANANQGSFISEDKILKQYFEDGELQYITREDGSLQIVKDGTTMGFTTADGVVSAPKVDTTPASTTSTTESGLTRREQMQKELANLAEENRAKTPTPNLTPKQANEISNRTGFQKELSKEPTGAAIAMTAGLNTVPEIIQGNSHIASKVARSFTPNENQIEAAGTASTGMGTLKEATASQNASIDVGVGEIKSEVQISASSTSETQPVGTSSLSFGLNQVPLQANGPVNTARKEAPSINLQGETITPQTIGQTVQNGTGSVNVAGTGTNYFTSQLEGLTPQTIGQATQNGTSLISPQIQLPSQLNENPLPAFDLTGINSSLPQTSLPTQSVGSTVAGAGVSLPNLSGLGGGATTQTPESLPDLSAAMEQLTSLSSLNNAGSTGTNQISTLSPVDLPKLEPLASSPIQETSGNQMAKTAVGTGIGAAVESATNILESIIDGTKE